MNKAVFLDKDGTLVPDMPYNVKPGLITLSDDCIEGLKILQEEGFLLVVVSNQSGVAHGYFNEAALLPVEMKLKELLNEQNLLLSGFYYCPHHPEGKLNRYTFNCACRKPEAGMLLNASVELDIDLERSWMIGDILNDVEAGNRAGCGTILIDNGNETEWLSGAYRLPQARAKNINEAAGYILSVINHGKRQLERL